jgi:hypothetical protein
MPNSKKKIPEFHSEEEERKFWATHDSTEFIDWRAAQRRRFPKLKKISKLANKRDLR